jgi:hypothetical protein
MNYVVLPVGEADFFTEESIKSWNAFCLKNKAKAEKIQLKMGTVSAVDHEWNRWKTLLEFLKSIKGTAERIIFADPRNTFCQLDCPADLFGKKGDPIAVRYHQGDRYWRVVQMVEAAAFYGNAEFTPETYVDDGLVIFDGDSAPEWIETMFSHRKNGVLPSTVLSWMLNAAPHNKGRAPLDAPYVNTRQQTEKLWSLKPARR